LRRLERIYDLTELSLHYPVRRKVDGIT
jgi:hypothetical protein